MSTKTYAPKHVQVIVFGNILSGFAPGTYINAEREVDAFAKEVGADGEVARVQSANKSGEITLTLMQTSDSNNILSNLAVADELNRSSIGPIIIKDSLGTTVLFSGEGWIRKLPAVEMSDELTPREWIFDTTRQCWVKRGDKQ